MDRALEVKFRAQDETFFHRILDVRIGSQQTLTTPARAVDARLIRKISDATPLKPRLYEAYVRSGADAVDARLSVKDRELRFSYELNSIRRTAGDGALLLLQDFYETGYPHERQLEFLVRTAHGYSDLLVIPMVSRVTDKLDADTRFDRYLEFLRAAMALIETYNKKPVMGVLPMRTPFVRIGDLVSFYCNRGVRAFCLDFAGSRPDTALQSVEQVSFSLAKENALEESFIHATNVSPGRPRRVTPVSPCHSILSYGYGADSFGDLHRTRMKIEGTSRDPSIRPARLFSRLDYGDHQVNTASDLGAIQPEATDIDLEKCIGNRDLSKLFNAEQHFLEANALPRIIQAGRDEPGLSTYLSAKAYVDPAQLKRMKGLRASLRQSRIA